MSQSKKPSEYGKITRRQFLTSSAAAVGSASLIANLQGCGKYDISNLYSFDFLKTQSFDTIGILWQDQNISDDKLRPDMHETLQKLIKISIDYNLIPAGEAIEQRLSEYRVLLVPQSRLVFEANPDLAVILKSWLTSGQDRFLIIDSSKETNKLAGLSAGDSAASSTASSVVNLDPQFFDRLDNVPLFYGETPSKIEFADNARVITRYDVDSIGRDILFRIGGGNVCYINGSLENINSSQYWAGLLTKWAKVKPIQIMHGDRVRGNISICFESDRKNGKPGQVTRWDGYAKLAHGKITNTRPWWFVKERGDSFDPRKISWRLATPKTHGDFNCKMVVLEIDTDDKDVLTIETARSGKVTIPIRRLLYQKFMTVKEALSDTLSIRLVRAPIGLGKIPYAKNYHKINVHTHSSYSDARPWSTDLLMETLTPYVDHVLFTDHDFLFSSTAYATSKVPGEDPFTAGGSNPSTDFKKIYPEDRYCWPWFPVVDNNVKVHVDIKPSETLSSDQRIFIEILFTDYRHKLYYVLNNPADRLPENYIRFDYTPGKWNHYELDVTKDFMRIIGDYDVAVYRVNVGVESRNGRQVKAQMRNVHVTCTRTHEDLWHHQAKRFSRYEKKYPGLKLYYGLELTGIPNMGMDWEDSLMHFTVYFDPTKGTPLRLDNRKFTNAQKTEYFSKVHKNGGAIAFHHTNGKNAWGSVQKHRGWGHVDMVEMNSGWGGQNYSCGKFRASLHGYPIFDISPHYMPMFDHLCVWDMLTDDRIYLTGYSSLDIHGIYATSYAGEKGGLCPTAMSWVYAEDETMASFIKAMRTGQLYFGDYEGQIVADLNTASGHKMGSIVYTDKSTQTLSMLVKPAQPGYTIAVIENGLKTRTFQADSLDFSKNVTIDTSADKWVRFEVYDRNNWPIVMTNWIAFVRQPLKKWPDDRAAIDFENIKTGVIKDFNITAMTVNKAADALQINGAATADNASVEFVCGAKPELEILPSSPTVKTSYDSANNRLLVTELAKGQYSLSLKLR